MFFYLATSLSINICTFAIANGKPHLQRASASRHRGYIESTYSILKVLCSKIVRPDIYEPEERDTPILLGVECGEALNNR